MERPPLPTPIRVIGYATGVTGIATLLITIAQRVASPWPLEWMEGATLQHALRILHGQPLYGPPSAEFIPFLYPPLAYVPMAVSTGIFGPTLWACRVVSILALAGSLACIFVTARRGSASSAVGCWATGVYAFGFGYTGAFGDVARVDAVFMLLVLLGVERLSASRVNSGLAWLGLSCFAKQHGLVFFAAAGLALCIREPRRARAPLLAASAATLAGLLALQLCTGGNFFSYVFSVPAGHGLIPRLLASYLAVDVLAYLPVLAAFVTFGSRGKHAQALGGEHRLVGWALLAAGLTASALGRAHPGGDDNVRLPGFALLVLAAACALPDLWQAARTPATRAVCLAALVLQPALLLQLPAAHAPSARSAQQFVSLRQALQRCANGDLEHAVALDHALLTGRPFVHTMALSDLRQSDDAMLRATGTQKLLAALSRADAPPSVALSVSFPELDEVIRKHYALCAELPALRLATGYTLAPARVYRRANLHP